MGGKGSSSKPKSSKRKRDKASSKKKSRRNESKKRRYVYDLDVDSLNSEHSSSSTSKSRRRRRINKKKKLGSDTSVSSYFDDQSVSSDSDSLSSYDNSYKSRKVRRSRVVVKDTKRKGRKRHTSPNGDVDARSVRRRKRLGRDHVVKPIKKSSKKKSKIHLRSSSISGSESCSTGQSKSSSSTADRKRKRSKVIPDKEIDKLRGRKSHRSKKKRKVRTPSCSSCGRGSDPSFNVSNSDGAFFPVNNSRRLRSIVIAVVDQPRDEEGNIWEKDPHKEEIVCDQSDYPSPKSLDSNEGGSKMESGNHYQGALCGEKVAGEEVPELGKSRVDEGDRKNANVCRSEGGHMNNCEKEKEKEKEIDVSVPVAAVEGDVMESILRQKALENLRKFRGRPQTGARSSGAKLNNESNEDRSSTVMADVVHNKSIEQGSSNAQEINQGSGLSLKRDSSLIKEVKKLLEKDRSSTVMVDVVHNKSIEHGSSNAQELKGSGLSLKRYSSLIKEVKKLPEKARSSTVMVDVVHKKSTEQGSSNAREMNQGSGLSLKRDPSLIKEVKKLSDNKQFEKESGMDKKSDVHPPNRAALVQCSKEEKSASSRAVLVKPVSGSDTSTGAGGTNACSSSTMEPSLSVQPSTGEDNLERGNDPKDGSQFEQKTMSVVRGGEVVQVSYKVYIPKKAPALARRQLRR